MGVWDFIYNLFPRLYELTSAALGGLPTWASYLILGLIGIVLILFFVILVVMLFVWFERRLVGRFQIRLGPNRAGPAGLFQPIADVIKLLLKESFTPSKADRWVYFLAPVVAVVPAFLIFAVVPIQVGAGGILVDLNIGILYIVAISTISVVGVFMAGWGSSNKYSLVGAMRTVAQMVSYEVPLVLSIIGVVLIAGSLSMVTIVKEQAVPFILLQPLGFLIFFLGSLAEINRSPFDLLEAESEIVAGFHTEYPGIWFAIFFLAEYGHALAVSAIVTTLFLGGWMGPGLPPYLWFFIKVLLVFSVMLWLRSTLPRFRVDQLMGFAWKYLFPLALVNIFITGFEAILWPDFPWPIILVNILVMGVLIVLWSRFFPLEEGFRLERYGIGIAKGMALTFKHLFRRPITVQYPEQRLTPSRRFRGNELVLDLGRCTGCGACVRACPLNIIHLETRRGPEKGLIVERFDVEAGRCMYCGLCVESCPVGCLFMGRSYERATYRLEELTVGMDRLTAPDRKPSAYAHPEMEKEMPEQTLLAPPKGVH